MMDFLMALFAYDQRFPFSCNHSHFPLLFSFEIFHLVDVVNLKRDAVALRAAQFAFASLQSGFKRISRVEVDVILHSIHTWQFKDSPRLKSENFTIIMRFFSFLVS